MRWFLLAVLFVVALPLACSSGDSCDLDAGPCLDGGTGQDGTSGVDSGGNVCSCPKPDAALLNPTTCCAGDSCVATHFDGISKAFADCYGVGSFVTPLAMDACHAHFGSQVTCTNTTCGLAQVVEGSGPGCVAWAYQGADTTLIGHVHVSTEAGACQCPTATDPSWY